MSLVGLHAYGGGNPTVGWGWTLGFEARDLAIGGKRLGYHLIPVVILVCCKAVYEKDMRLLVCEVFAACVECEMVEAWDGVIGKPSA